MTSASMPTPVGTRSADLLDVALANAMLAGAGLSPLRSVVDGLDVVRVAATPVQCDALHLACWQSDMGDGVAWMTALAPRLVAGVVDIVGQDWLAEAELGVELTVAVRAERMGGFAAELSSGPVWVDGGASAAAVIADCVPDPALVRFL